MNDKITYRGTTCLTNTFGTYTSSLVERKL